MLKQIPYYLLKWTSSARHFVISRFTLAGMLLLACLITSGLLGLDTYKTTAYEIFTFLFSLLFISFIASVRPPAKLSASRALPKMCTAGETFRYTISAKNEQKKNCNSILITEKLPDPRPTMEELNYEFKKSDTRGKLKSLLSKKGYLGAWQRQVNIKLLAKAAPGKPVDIPSGGGVETSIKMTPMRRGFIRFKSIRFSQPDLLGLMNKLKETPLEESLLVLPKRYPLPAIILPGRRMHHQGGVSLASNVGNADEFMALRDYRPGDPLRAIHWKSWAKTGKPVVKEHEDEHFSRHALILDTFADNSASELFEEAVSVAASFASSIGKGESLLDLIFVGDEAYSFTSGRHTGTTQKMLEILASVELCEDKNFDTLSNAVLSKGGLFSSSICIFIDWDKKRESFIEKLRASDIPLMVFIITEDGQNPHFEGMKTLSHDFHILKRDKIGETLIKL